ncbi:MAG: hypothetical protein KDB01_11775, partial [Planctomycetaceae bacterium]|nr:hypothetical protein [Planctomycetaceae bacterium]
MDQNPYSIGNHADLQQGGLQGKSFTDAVRGMQIIAAALMTGVLVFLGIVLMMTQGDVLGTHTPEMVTILGAGFGVLAIVNHFVIPKIIAGSQLRQIVSNGFSELDAESKSDRLLSVYRGQLIVALAMLEGAAFFNLIALMVEKNVVALGVATLLLSAMVFRFPSRDKVV